MSTSNAPATKVMVHGHHQISAALFVGSLIIGAPMILSAELTKPLRYEYRPTNDQNAYVLFDSDTGRTTVVQNDSKAPTDRFKN